MSGGTQTKICIGKQDEEGQHVSPWRFVQVTRQTWCDHLELKHIAVGGSHLSLCVLLLAISSQLINSVWEYKV